MSEFFLGIWLGCNISAGATKLQAGEGNAIEENLYRNFLMSLPLPSFQSRNSTNSIRIWTSS